MMQPILQHIFKKDNLQEVPLDALQKLTEEFPYFPVGQFLLTKKMQQLGETDSRDQFQKTLIYFHNPLWLQYKMSETELFEETPQQLAGDSLQSTETEQSSSVMNGLSSHDLVEEVVLHQENDYAAADLQPSVTPVPLEAPSVEIINGQKDLATQTIHREEPFTFQAYHTVDYFASQGIKLNLDSQQHDKLGKQLKSFTEWLKTMRRLPETSVVEMLDKIKEGEITKIAATSLEEKEVITEAMAEVLVKQGQVGKALELYSKLSLQNPHKSTYFAAKIEDLKLN